MKRLSSFELLSTATYHRALASSDVKRTSTLAQATLLVATSYSSLITASNMLGVGTAKKQASPQWQHEKKKPRVLSDSLIL